MYSNPAGRRAIFSLEFRLSLFRMTLQTEFGALCSNFYAASRVPAKFGGFLIFIVFTFIMAFLWFNIGQKILRYQYLFQDVNVSNLQVFLTFPSLAVPFYIISSLSCSLLFNILP